MAFPDLDRLVGRAVNRAYGETVEIVPMVQSQHKGPAPDVDRPARPLRARFALSAEEEPFQGARRGTEMSGMGRMAQDAASIALERADLDGLGYDLAAGDCMKRADGAVYTLSVPHRADTGAVIWTLILETTR